MFPHLEAFRHLGTAMGALYCLLAATSLSVRLAARGAPPGMLSDQVNAWWRIFPVVSLALLTYPLGLTALAALVCLLALLELSPYYPGSRRRFWGLAGVIVAGALGLQQAAPAFAPAILLGALGLQGALLAWRRRPAALIWLLVLATGAAMAMLTAFASLPLDAHAKLGWLFYLFILTALNDIGQFVSGKLFGRRKLAPRISPNKTWEGAAGGMLVSLAVSLVLGSALGLAGPGLLAALALPLSLGGLAGDLAFSSAKRHLAIKDFSQLIPGHGGILDRVDSLVVTAPLLYCLLSMFV